MKYFEKNIIKFVKDNQFIPLTKKISETILDYNLSHSNQGRRYQDTVGAAYGITDNGIDGLIESNFTIFTSPELHCHT